MPFSRSAFTATARRLAVAVKAEREKGIGMVKSVLDRVREGK